ncbi:MAG: TonB-dependent receptor plug domain-containing protein [bacterium]
MKIINSINARRGLILALSALSATALAQSVDPTDQSLQDALMFLQAETKVVTVSKVAESIRKAGGTVTVIDQQDIRNMGARDLVDVLRTVPGIGVSQNVIGAAKIESRGIATLLSEKVLLMMDGHVVNSNLVNGGAMGYFDLVVDNVSRVEVVRGPSSALYGADAFVAVINVITMTAEEMDGTSIALTLGEDSTGQFNIQGRHVSDDFNVAVNVNYFDTDGYPAKIDSDLLGNSGTADFPEEKIDLHLTGNYRDLLFKSHYVDSERGGFMNFADTLAEDSFQKYKSYFVDFAYNLEVGDNLVLTPRVYYDFFSFDNFFENFQARFASDSIKTGIEMQGRYEGFDQHTIIAGLQYEDQQHDNVKTWVGNPDDGFVDVSDVANFNRDASRDLAAFYVEDLWDLTEDLRVSLGGRYDRYSDFGGNFSPRASASWLISDVYDVKVLYGEAFRAPTFADQFNANQDAILGGVDLDPELIKTIEIGFGAKIGDYGTTRFTLFRNRLEDILTSLPGEPTVNSDEHRVDGLEIEGRFKLGSDVSLRANYTYQDPEDASSGEQLPDVPRHRGNILLDYRFAEHCNLNTHVYFQGDTERAAGDPRDDNDGYTLVNMSLTSSQLAGVSGLEGRLSVYNLLDEDYTDPSSIVTDYPQPDRTVHGQLTYRFR